MTAFKKLSSWVEKVLHIFIAATFTILIGACVLQVFTRFVLNDSLSWTEELARYAFIWSNFLGAAVCTQKGSHATVTAITDNLPPKAKLISRFLVSLVVILISFVLIRYGFKVAFAVRSQLSPALRLSMGFVYGAAPVSGLFILFYSGVQLYNSVRELCGKETLS